MGRSRFKAREIVSRLREADVLIAQGQAVAQFYKQISVTDRTNYRWREEYSGPQANLRQGPGCAGRWIVSGEGEIRQGRAVPRERLARAIHVGRDAAGRGAGDAIGCEMNRATHQAAPAEGFVNRGERWAMLWCYVLWGWCALSGLCGAADHDDEVSDGVAEMDKREHPRVTPPPHAPLPFTLRGEACGTSAAGHAVDISVGGIGIRVSSITAAAFETIERVKVLIDLPGHPSEVGVSGVICHRRPVYGLIHYGIKFEHGDCEESQRIQDAITSYVMEHLHN